MSSHPEDVDLAGKAGVPCLLLAPDAAEAWIAHGARDASKVITTEAVGMPGEWVAACRYLPGLSAFLDGEGPAIGFVESIERKLAEVSTAGDLLVHNGCIVVSRSWVTRTPWPFVLRRVAQAVASLLPLSKPIDEVIGALDRSEIDRRRAAVRAEPDLPRRLLRAVRSPEALRRDRGARGNANRFSWG